ncbi:MAG TPA: hypothetical protein VG276_20935 [Actinomycetes bacterium]|jgi:hypothetical protein|nr:hypothetical protein [Actinomycetes bacterium]
MRSCSSSVVFVEEPAEQVAAVHSAPVIPARDGEPGARVWRLQHERAVGTVAVVMLDVDPKDLLQVPTPEDQQPVQALGTDLRTQRSAYAFALGAWNGVTSTSPPSEQNTPSKLRGTVAQPGE